MTKGRRQPLKTIFWDLDGTILNSFGVYSAVLTDVLVKRGLSIPSSELLSSNFHGSLRESIAASCGLSVDDVLLDQILDDFLTIQEGYYDDLEQHFFPDALKLMTDANRIGLSQFIVTNRFHEKHGKASPRSIIERSKLKPLIHHVIAGDDGIHTKPDRKVLSTLPDVFSWKPDSTVVIGDQFVDVEFADALGVAAVILDRTAQQDERLKVFLEAHPDQQLRTQLVKSLDELRFNNGILEVAV